MEIKGQKAIEYLKNKLSIINSQVIEIRLVSTFENYDIILILNLKGILIEILFENIIEFSFYHNSSYVFYNIDDYKLFYIDDSKVYYMSLDPNNDLNEICDNDGDFLKAKNLIVKIND